MQMQQRTAQHTNYTIGSDTYNEKDKPIQRGQNRNSQPATMGQGRELHRLNRKWYKKRRIVSEHIRFGNSKVVKRRYYKMVNAHILQIEEHRSHRADDQCSKLREA